MEFMKEYAISIITVSVLAILLENILPADNNKKYIHVMIGLFVMLVMLGPLTKLPHYSETFFFPSLHIGDEDLSVSNPQPYVAQNFERNLALAICEDVHSAFHKTVDCRIFCTTNEDGQITGIRKVTIAPYNAEITKYIIEKYGFEEGIVAP